MEYNQTHRRERHDPMLSDITRASSKVLVEWLDHDNPDVVLRAEHEIRVREGKGEIIMHESSEVMSEKEPIKRTGGSMNPDQMKTLTPEGYGGDFELTMEAGE